MSNFWGNDVQVLFQKDEIYEIIPIPQMSYIQKLNALSRLIILISFIFFIFTFSIKYLIAGIFSLACIYFFYKFNKIEKIEGFQTTLENFIDENYYPTKESNPMGNVLLTEYLNNPTRKSAAPSFNPEVVVNINEKTKKMTKETNGFKTNEVFSGLGNNIEFEESMQQFYTTASTTIPNDQGAFGDYLYGDMSSCKEDPIQCVKNNYRYIS
jgi:hypothetical protein